VQAGIARKRRRAPAQYHFPFRVAAELTQKVRKIDIGVGKALAERDGALESGDRVSAASLLQAQIQADETGRRLALVGSNEQRREHFFRDRRLVPALHQPHETPGRGGGGRFGDGCLGGG